jgi:hypothetical protein
MGFHPLRSKSLDSLGDLDPVVLPLNRNPGRYSVRRHGFDWLSGYEVTVSEIDTESKLLHLSNS